MTYTQRWLVFAGALGLLALLGWSIIQRPQRVSPPPGDPFRHHARAETDEASTPGPGAADTALPGAAAAPDAARRPLVCAPPEGHAATVGDEALAVATLCTRLGGMGSLGSAGADLPQARIALEQLIDGMLVRQALALERAEVTEAELAEALTALQPQRPEAGVDPLLRTQMRERLELQRLLDTRLNTAVTEGDVDVEIARGAPDIDRGQGVRVEAWMARRGPRPADRPEAQEAAEAFARAVQTQSPAEAARRLGLAPLAPFVLGAHGTEPDLEAAASGLSPGQWSGAVSTRVGWVVLRVIAREEGETLPPDVLRARVRQALERRRLQTARQDLLVALRAHARIEILVDL